MEKKALGKGLQALLPEKKYISAGMGAEVLEIPLDKIIPNRSQPRTIFGESELQALAKSLKETGVLQPIVVRRIGDGSFELVAGERRWRAAKLAGLPSVPSLVRVSNDEKSLVLALVENIQREGLNPMEEARAYSRLLTEFGLTQDQVGMAIGKDRSSVANIIRLVSLPNEIQKLIENYDVTLGHAKVLAGIANVDDQLAVAKKIVKDQLSVRQTEMIVEGLRKKEKTQTILKSSRRQVSPVEEQLRKKLETKVKVAKGARGGQIVIHFYSDDDLSRIAGIILE
jgi:ParB family chromosome partitioning protein